MNLMAIIQSLMILNIFVVQSGSMEPTIKTGSLALSVKQANYVTGDVISFYTDSSKKTIVTHRIVSNIDGRIYTSGDANMTVDSDAVLKSNILGRVFFTVPYLGYIVNWAKTPQGLIFFVLIPATIIVYEELKFLKGEIGKYLKGRGFKLKFNRKTLMFIPIIGSFVFFTSLTGSFFNSNSSSTGNVLSVTSQFPTNSPSPSPYPTNPGDVFLDSVVAVFGTYGHCCDINNLSSDALTAESFIKGAPDSPPNTNFIQISNGSIVTAKFVDNKVIDGLGNDIRLHIYDTLFPGTAKVEVAQGPDCVNASWQYIGDAVDSVNTEFDISTVSLSEVQCIRFTDLGGPDTTYPELGYDLDAVEALNSVIVP